MCNELLSEKIHNAYITANRAELQRLWEEEVPSELIKFFPASYLADGTNFFLEHLKNKTIWLASPIVFNDPFDCIYNYDYWKLTDEVKKDFLKKFSNNKLVMEIFDSNFFKEKFQQISEGYRNQIIEIHNKHEKCKYITCFSEMENLYSKRMWAHYAASHKGVCAVYNFKQVNNVCDFGCIPVKYTDSYARKIQTSTISEDVEEYLKLVYNKASEWSYEKEWRIVKEAQEGGTGFNVKCNLPKKIFLGCRVSKKLKEDILTFCKDKEIEVFQMKIKSGSFDLDFEICNV